jgi:2-C-methyl-D-erythritol 4-phosphate cytidylyltransferase
MTRPSRRAARSSDRAVAVVPAGGAGARMNRRRPKQYLWLDGAPLLVHTLRALLESEGMDGVVLVVPADRVAGTRRLLDRHHIPRILDVVPGGSERQESVWRGLQAVPAGAGWVVVHDAVRPFITGGLVERVLSAARRHGAATCGLEVRETVKRVKGAVVEATLDRDRLWLIQTPQAFRRDLLCEAHDKARRDGFTGTDDAVLVERLGESVAVVPGLAHNLKITTPSDLRIARLWLATSSLGRAERPLPGPRRPGAGARRRASGHEAVPGSVARPKTRAGTSR